MIDEVRWQVNAIYTIHNISMHGALPLKRVSGQYIIVQTLLLQMESNNFHLSEWIHIEGDHRTEPSNNLIVDPMINR